MERQARIDPFWYWVAERRAHDNPRGDFVRDTRDLLSRDRDPATAIVGGCEEALRWRDILREEYDRVAEPETPKAFLERRRVSIWSAPTVESQDERTEAAYVTLKRWLDGLASRAANHEDETLCVRYESMLWRLSDEICRLHAKNGWSIDQCGGCKGSRPDLHSTPTATF